MVAAVKYDLPTTILFYLPNSSLVFKEYLPKLISSDEAKIIHRWGHIISFNALGWKNKCPAKLALTYDYS